MVKSAVERKDVLGTMDEDAKERCREIYTRKKRERLKGVYFRAKRR